MPKIALACWLLTLSAAAAAAESSSPVPLAQRVAAAQATAQTAAACAAVKPFYWEIGDAKEALASGSVGADAPTRSTPLAIASASKWIFAAYVAERRGGKLSDDDVAFLGLRSGYTRFRICRAAQSVAACMDSRLNGSGEVDPAAVGRFSYGGGHMQREAMQMGLGGLDAAGLAAEVRRGLAPLGTDWGFGYRQAQPAGGGSATAGDYARFLQAVLADRLQIGRLLGAHPICANPQTCPKEALRTPIPHSETWHYAIGHWVEDDPKVGDGAFSSPGAFGFYPWINSEKDSYGIVAHQGSLADMLSGDQPGRPAIQSAYCGRLLRAAWKDGQARR